LHIAAVTQVRHDTPGRAYYQRKLAAGKTHKEAMRCLKRRIADAVYRQLRGDLDINPPAVGAWPRWPTHPGRHYRSPATARRGDAPRSKTSELTEQAPEPDDHLVRGST
jgi:hypothetical protein